MFYLHVCVCDGVGSSGTKATKGGELPYGCCGLNLSLLREQSVLLVTELSL